MIAQNLDQQIMFHPYTVLAPSNITEDVIRVKQCGILYLWACNWREILVLNGQTIVATAVQDIRKRKGLAPDPPKAEDFIDKE